MTAFLVSGIAATVPSVVGAPYRDASGSEYLPMLGDIDLVGIAFRAERKTVDKIVDRLRLHP